MQYVDAKTIIKLNEALLDYKPVTGFTHCFYRYPARFSPQFVKAAIEAFTDTDDIVFDPFMGGGTTIVEAQALKRRAIGTDINSLAVFVSRVKTTPLSVSDFSEISEWFSNTERWLNLRNPPVRDTEWIDKGYQRNLSGRTTWPTRKAIELALNKLGELSNEAQRDFVRCVILRTAQWAVDCRYKMPSAKDFREQLKEYFSEMSQALTEFRETTNEEALGSGRLPVCLNRSAVGIELDETMKLFAPPKLILTSPPYPGVHVLYHRWQVRGRKETPAPFWITGTLDGEGSSHYTFGGRKQRGLSGYFSQAREVYKSLAKISDPNTVVVQVLAFSDPAWQLQAFLEVMEEAGFSEMIYPLIPTTSTDGRIWRNVPNRKFYADSKGDIPASKEVLLIHKLP